MSIDVRPASDRDAELLARLNRPVQELHVAGRPDYFKRVDAGAVATWFRSMLRKPAVRAWIATFHGAPAGYILTVTYDRAENTFCGPRHFCEIDQIAVLSEFRRHGIARALVEQVRHEARSRAIAEVELTSWSFNNEAHAAFCALGFSPRIVRYGRTSSP
jgi:ribosomal protein S18 acetylase RimI-like enzyme